MVNLPLTKYQLLGPCTITASQRHLNTC
jgi:hypothetical protein